MTQRVKSPNGILWASSVKNLVNIGWDVKSPIKNPININWDLTTHVKQSVNVSWDVLTTTTIKNETLISWDVNEYQPLLTFINDVIFEKL